MARYRGFNRDDVVGIHTGVLIRSNEMKMDGILNEGNLQLAVGAQDLRVYKRIIYRGPVAKIGALMYELITLHPFIEGNKRTGFMCADILLILNNYIMLASDKERSDVSLSVAKLNMNRDELIDWLRKHTIRLEDFKSDPVKMIPAVKQIKARLDGQIESLKEYQSRHLDRP